MPGRVYGVTFEGYWRDENEAGIPAMSGIFCVYGCVENAEVEAVALDTLMYIGEADDVKHSIANHEMLPEWRRLLRPGEELCFSFAHVSPADRLRCAAALIYRHQPPCNSNYKSDFPFARTTISLLGQISQLHANFTVEPKSEALAAKAH